MSENPAFAAAAAALGELQNPGFSRTVKTDKYRFDYAELSVILNGVRPILAKHGLFLVQPTSNPAPGVITVTTRLIYKDGTVVAEGTLSRKDEAAIQQTGSAITYLRRYSLCSLLGIAADEDDDGTAAEGIPAQHQPRPAPTPKASPQPAEPTPAEALTYLSAVLTRCKLTSGQVNVWRKTKNLGPLSDLEPGKLIEFADWLAGRKEEFLAGLRT